MFERLVARWLEACAEARLPVAASFSLIDVMAEQVVVREWQQLGLPVDDYSAENGILATGMFAGAPEPSTVAPAVSTCAQEFPSEK